MKTKKDKMQDIGKDLGLKMLWAALATLGAELTRLFTKKSIKKGQKVGKN